MSVLARDVGVGFKRKVPVLVVPIGLWIRYQYFCAERLAKARGAEVGASILTHQEWTTAGVDVVGF
ncbi:MAG: hypothetical protein AB7V46_12755 [Thermomicrobiales bacterium]